MGKLKIGDLIYLERSCEFLYVDESWYNHSSFEPKLLIGERLATKEEKEEYLNLKNGKI